MLLLFCLFAFVNGAHGRMVKKVYILNDKYSKIPQKIQKHNRKKPFSSLLSQSLLSEKKNLLSHLNFCDLVTIFAEN